jgi:cytochrome c biogenesis factor
MESVSQSVYTYRVFALWPSNNISMLLPMALLGVSKLSSCSFVDTSTLKQFATSHESVYLSKQGCQTVTIHTKTLQETSLKSAVSFTFRVSQGSVMCGADTASLHTN